MDQKTIFIRTDTGEAEIRGRASHLSGDIKRALLMVDGHSEVSALIKRSAPSLRTQLMDLLADLERGGFVRDASQPVVVSKLVVPKKSKTPSAGELEGEDLDFTAAYRAPTPEVLAAEAAKLKAAAAEQAEAKLKQELEQTRQAAEQAAAAAREQAQAEAERIRREAEEKAQREIEAVSHKVQAEAEAAKLKSEQEAGLARLEAEQAKQRAEQALQESEAIRLRAEGVARAQREAEARIKQEIESARQHSREAVEQAQAEAAAARLQAEEEAARIKTEMEAAVRRAEAEAEALKAAEKKARTEIEAARAQAQADAEALRIRAEEEVAKARLEAEQARLEAEREAEHIRAELEAERQRAAEEAVRVREQAAAAAAQARIAAETQLREALAAADQAARQQAEAAAEAARKEVDQATAQARAEAEVAAQHVREQAEAQVSQLRAEAESALQHERVAADKRLQEAEADLRRQWQETAEQEAEARRAAEKQIPPDVAVAQTEALHPEAVDAALLKDAAATVQPERGAAVRGTGKRYRADDARSTSATVLFFDIVGYTKKPVKQQIRIKELFTRLLTGCLSMQPELEHIVLDTGDGAAIGFLHHPETALEVALQFRRTILENPEEYKNVHVRMGIHLGPISVVKDMNGLSNMLGDGINDAQRVMSFAGTNELYISRPYFDFISRLSDEYELMFAYEGTRHDKHGREHQVYALRDDPLQDAAAVTSVPAQEPEIMLAPFDIGLADAPPMRTEPAVETAPVVERFIAPVEAPAPRPVEVLIRPAEPLATPEPVAEPPLPVSKPEPQLPTPEEVAALAQSQAKVWAEAEQRAQRQAEWEAQRSAEAAEHKASIVEVPQRRAPLPWGKGLLTLTVLLLAALLAAPYWFPAEGYRKSLEQRLSESVGQPVQVHSLQVSLLPQPALLMQKVSMGAGALVVVDARADLAFSALFSDRAPVERLSLTGLVLEAGSLPLWLHWLQAAGGDARTPLSRVVLEQARLRGDGMMIEGVSGELVFNGGQLQHAALQSGGHTRLVLEKSAAQGFAVTLNVQGASVPYLPDWKFDDLSATGQLSEQALVLQDFDARIAGGVLQGDVRLSWGTQWQSEGTLQAKVVTLGQLGTALSGDLNGKARFGMQAPALAQLVPSTVMDGDFVVTAGEITGMDLVEGARLRGRSVAAGRTRFDTLAGTLSLRNGTQRYGQLKLRSGVLEAAGGVQIENGALSGQLLANLNLRADMGPVSLRLGGTPAAPRIETP